MKKFVLIDHSLKDLGGHYYTYASCVLPAAERAGFHPVLAMNREFRDFAALPASWQSYAIFRRKSYSQRLPGHTPSNGALTGWWSRTRRAWRIRARARIAEGFAADCAALFARLSLAEGDHVFIATASELDLEGLAIFLQSAPKQYRQVQWHLQFHLGIFEGRDPDYAAQTGSREPMREVFLQALQRIPDYDVHMYCTTLELTAQYQFLEVAPFHTLPYPIHPLFRQTSGAKTAVTCARIACLGHSRREKGYRELPIVIRKLWADYLSKGRAQLVMQTRRRDLRRELDSAVADLGAHSPTEPVVYAPFPLDLEQYAELVRSTDVGLLLYDSTRYYARCSGVLLEMLSAGVPVIVPGGCWLSGQIHDENQRHLRDIAARVTPLARIGPETLAWSTKPVADTNAHVVSFTRTAAVCELNLPAASRSLLVRFRWLAPTTPGTYAQIDLQQLDSHGTALPGFAAIVGPSNDTDAVLVLFHLGESTARVRLTWRNAWGTGAIAIADVECLPLAGHHPAGAVGLTAANMDQSSELLDDVLRHIDHYRRNAALFAQRCGAYYNGDETVAQIIAAKSAPEQPIAHTLSHRLERAPHAGA